MGQRCQPRFPGVNGNDALLQKVHVMRGKDATENNFERHKLRTSHDQASSPPFLSFLRPRRSRRGPHASALNVSVDHGVPLTFSEPAASVFIANPDIADVQVMSPTSIMIFGKRTGETTFMASDANGHTLAQRTVIVMQDLTDLRRELDVAIPGTKIQVQPLPNGIVLTGEAKDPAAVADAFKMAQRYIPNGGDIINRIKVGGSNQIHIRVRFAEVSRNVDNSLGFDWQNLRQRRRFRARSRDRRRFDPHTRPRHSRHSPQ